MSTMPGGGMPRPSPPARSAFEKLVPEALGVTTRPMFGHLAAFVNGHMFAGLFGDALFVRVDDDATERLLAAGGSPFQPMQGRPMRGYTCLAAGWQSAPEAAGEWVRRALTHTAGLPPKTSTPRRRGGART